MATVWSPDTPHGMPQPSWVLLTCFTVHSKVLLALQHAVDYPGTATIRGVISIRCHHLHHRGACSRDKEENKKLGRRREEQPKPQGQGLAEQESRGQH